MRHLILFAYALVLTTGLLGLGALGLRILLQGGRLAKALVGLQASFFGGLLIVAVAYYRTTLDLAGQGDWTRGLGLASGLANLGIYAFAILALTRLHGGGQGGKALRSGAGAAALLFMVHNLGSLAVLLLAGKEAPRVLALMGSEGWSLSGYALAGVAILLLGLALVRLEPPEEEVGLLPYQRAWGWAGLAFAPLGVLEFFLNGPFFETLRPLSLDYLFYLAWNGIALATVTTLKSRARLAASPALGLEASLSLDKAEALGLTRREFEMARLIARGLANKEIAADLGISASTVRTHIYNLYQKAGARSRIELLNLLRD